MCTRTRVTRVPSTRRISHIIIMLLQCRSDGRRSRWFADDPLRRMIIILYRYLLIAAIGEEKKVEYSSARSFSWVPIYYNILSLSTAVRTICVYVYYYYYYYIILSSAYTCECVCVCNGKMFYCDSKNSRGENRTRVTKKKK